MRNTTLPLPAGLTWESYCEALGVDPSSARQASLLGCLAAQLRAQQAALDAAMGDAALTTLDRASKNSTRKP